MATKWPPKKWEYTYNYFPNHLYLKGDEYGPAEESYLRPAANPDKFWSPNDARIQQECALCGGVEFHCAIADYETTLRCVKCRWEAVVHSG